MTLLAKNRNMIARNREGYQSPSKKSLPSQAVVQYAHTLIEIHKFGSKDNPSAIKRLGIIFLFYLPVEALQHTPPHRYTFFIEGSRQMERPRPERCKYCTSSNSQWPPNNKRGAA